MATLTVDGAELSYAVDGDGPAIAFVHGWCSHSVHWGRVADAMAAQYRVVRWDRRGMGRSTTDVPAASAERHADDLAAILDAEGIDTAVVVGHAGGGPTTLSFATRHANRADAVGLVDIALNDPANAPAAKAYEQRIASIVDSLSGHDREPAMRGLYSSFFGPHAAADIVAEAVSSAVDTEPDVAVAELAHVLSDTAGAARRTSCPVLWISANPRDTAGVEDVFDDVMVGHVVGSGHFPQVEVPDQVEAMLRTFLHQRTSRASR